MSSKKIIILLLIIASLFLYKNFLRSDAKTATLSGYVNVKGDPKFSAYYNTLVNFYDTDPNWAPKQTKNIKNQPQIAGVSAIMVDLNTGDIVFDLNSQEKRQIGSLVKIMTAVVILEHADLNETTKISVNAAGIGENTMALDEGEVYTVEELLYGLMLNSGNDAAYALAEHVAGNAETFINWMQLKATELGLKNTYFADPSGLDDTTYSTAYDMVKLTRYALKNPDFRKIAKTVEIEFTSATHKYAYLYNQTNLLTTYPGVQGIKAGYTELSGLCLVTYAQNNGVELVGVVLGSADRRGDMILMLDHGFAEQGVYVGHNLL